MNPQHVIFVPGLLCTADLFADQIVSLRNGAEITVAGTGSATIEGMARELLDAAPERFALCGLSMGGYVALAVMQLAPERVTRLVLMDTSARSDSPEVSAQRRALVARAESSGLAGVTEEMIEGLVAPAARKNPALRARIHAMAEEIGVEGFARQQEAIIARPDRRPMLEKIRVPTLVVVGELDEKTPPELAREIAAGIPDAELAIVPGAGHMTTMEAPEETARLLGRHLLG